MPLYAIPEQNPIEIHHLVLDYNGTLAADGTLVPGVAERLRELALPPYSLTIHVVTADTMGTVKHQLHGLPYELFILGPAAQDKAKLEYVQDIGVEWTVAIATDKTTTSCWP